MFTFEWLHGVLYTCNMIVHWDKQVGRKEGHVLFNDALNTFYFIWRRTLW